MPKLYFVRTPVLYAHKLIGKGQHVLSGTLCRFAMFGNRNQGLACCLHLALLPHYLKLMTVFAPLLVLAHVCVWLTVFLGITCAGPSLANQANFAASDSLC